MFQYISEQLSELCDYLFADCQYILEAIHSCLNHSGLKVCGILSVGSGHSVALVGVHPLRLSVLVEIALVTGKDLLNWTETCSSNGDRQVSRTYSVFYTEKCQLSDILGNSLYPVQSNFW